MQLRCLGRYLTFLILFFIPAVADGQPDPKRFPFYPGERLTFELKWSILPVGEATLEILPVKTIEGTPAYHFKMTAKSYPFIDLFYKIRDRIEAFADTKMTHSLLYKKTQLEGSTHRDIVVTFDWQKGKAHYSNFGKEKRETPLRAGAFDPLSAFFYVRTLDLVVGKEIKRSITDGKKVVLGRVRVVKKDRIAVAGGAYDAFLLEPELKHVGGVFEKSKNAKIQVWVTADQWKIPIKLKSKVVVGSFTGTLQTRAGVGVE